MIETRLWDLAINFHSPLPVLPYWQPHTCIKGNHSKGPNIQYSHCYFKSYDIMKMTKNFYISALIFCHHVSHTNFLIRERKISIHADQHTNTTDLYIKSINLVRHSLLSVNTSARLLKGACPLSYPWVRLLCHHFCICIFM